MVPTVLNDQTERPKIYQYCLTNVTFLIITNEHYIWFKGQRSHNAKKFNVESETMNNMANE